MVLELCIAEPSFQSEATELHLPVSLGPPVDHRVVSGDVAERRLLEACVALHGAGVAVDFAAAAGPGPVARLPPKRPKATLCWPTAPELTEWTREVYTDAYEVWRVGFQHLWPGSLGAD